MIEMTVYKRHLSVPPDDVDEVHEFLQGIWDENPHIPLRDRFSFETALVELASNIILYSVVTSSVTCDIVIETSTDQINATISDNGDLVDLALDEHIMPDEFSESGRGIPLIKALVDNFEYGNSENKNTWRMSKRYQQ